MSPRQAKPQPIRMCVSCHQRWPKRELWRFVRTSLGQVFLDQQGRRFGRSAYLCQALPCIERARRRRLLERHLLSGVSEGIWAELESAMVLKQDG